MNKRNAMFIGIASIAAAVVAFFSVKRTRKEAEELIKPVTPETPETAPVQYIAGDLQKHPSKKYGRRLLNQIDKIIIHHSATTSGSPASYARYHVEENKWPGIGYHFVIQPDGQIFQTNKLSTISYHTSGQNTRSIGIVLTGDFDKQQPKAAQVESLVSLIRGLETELGRKFKIEGHNKHSTKTCPGDNVNLQQIINRVNQPAA